MAHCADWAYDRAWHPLGIGTGFSCWSAAVSLCAAVSLASEKWQCTRWSFWKPYLGMQFGDEPSISQVANRFMGTGLFRAPLPGKLSRPLLSAMVRSSRRSPGGVGQSDLGLVNTPGAGPLGVRESLREEKASEAHVSSCPGGVGAVRDQRSCSGAGGLRSPRGWLLCLVPRCSRYGGSLMPHSERQGAGNTLYKGYFDRNMLVHCIICLSDIKLAINVFWPAYDENNTARYCTFSNHKVVSNIQKCHPVLALFQSLP